MHKLERNLTLFLFLLIAPNKLPAALISLDAFQDNSIYESTEPFDFSSPELNKSNGAGDYLFTGRVHSDNNGLRRRALIQFDIASAIPENAVIHSASLTLYLSQTITEPTFLTTDVSLHKVTNSWGEGNSDASGQEGGGANAAINDTTWIHRTFNTTNWEIPGGDFDTNPSAITPVGNRKLFYTWESNKLAEDVQSWLDQPEGNNGWILIGDESQIATAKRFDSRERNAFDVTTGLQTKPQLNIEYTVIPEPSTFLLLSIGTLLLWKRLRFKKHEA